MICRAHRVNFRDDQMVDAHGMSFGLTCWQGEVGQMSVAHAHDDLELNVADVDLEYLIDGRTVVIPGGTLAVFWAARPHQLLRGSGHRAVTWLTVPLTDAVGWRLPADFMTRMFAGEVGRTAALGPLDLAERARHWTEELRAGHPLREAAVREVQSMLVRVADALPRDPAVRASSSLRPDVAEMVAWIAAHAADDIGVADVAARAHLHPRYAMSLFRAEIGVTIGDYITQCRVARARHLLLTTDRPVADIALEAGFGSLSQFYARFRERTGEPPAAYRRRLTRSDP
jgi:AraC-like DNA-binding protein